MKAKNQPLFTSEIDAKEKLIVYVYEYLIHSGAKQAADTFKENIGYAKDIKVNDGPGFLHDWWCVFWDLYCAAPERRHTQPESSREAQAFHDHMRAAPMSPSIAQTSPPQQGPSFMGPGPMGPMSGGARYGAHPSQIRGGPVNVGPRMVNMSQGIPPMMGAASPRYAPHPGHMTPGSGTTSGPMGPEPGPSPGVNRMTPSHVGSPHPPGPPGPPPGPPGPPPGQPMQQRGPPQGWQGSFVNAPADQQCFMPPVSSGIQTTLQPNDFGPQPSQHDEYVLPNVCGQQGDQGEAEPEIMKLKESLENSTKEYNEGGFWS